MTQIKRQPYDPGPAAWSSILPHGQKYPQLEENRNADWVVIGAGFAGLAAAKRLHELHPKDSIVILEARSVAEGPAGRNSGFMIDLPHNLSAQDYVGELNADVLQTQMNRHAIKFSENISQEYAFTPEAFVISGKINAAATAKGVKHNLDYANHLESLNEAYELLDEHQIRDICGSDYYQGGLFTAGTAMIQPVLFVREFAQGLAKNGISLYENSAVIEFEKEASNWLIKTEKASISTPKVILAVNGHIESFGYFKRRLVHIYLYASMTRKLSTSEIKNLGGDANWGFTPADAMGTTVRRISGIGGDRIIIRNRMTYNPDLNADKNKLLKFARKHEQSFNARFPKLNEVNMEYQWGGALCLSRNNAPAFGEKEEGLFAACCQNGLGTVQGTLVGILAAEQASGHDSKYLQNTLAQNQPSRLPPEPIAAIGANTLMRWGEFKAGREL
ncbi:MAG: glycine/D-amino acid oxidase-like deaminating enzyme [Cocleimonas sp.]|jgi:glycine/D-amino acid oxidase-like deaminating enzyme